MPPHDSRPALVILAGGQAKRMQTQHTPTHKCLIPLKGKIILTRILETLDTKNFCATAINANNPKNILDYTNNTLPLLPDRNPTAFWGPLAGILASMEWATTLNAQWLLSVPGDCPFLPQNLLPRLEQTRDETNAQIVCAASNNRTHPIIALWNTDLVNDLEQALYSDSIRKIDLWSARHKTTSAHWSETPDPFFNINTPEDIRKAETLASRLD